MKSLIRWGVEISTTLLITFFVSVITVSTSRASAGEIDPDFAKKLESGDIVSFTKALSMRSAASAGLRQEIDAAIGEGIINKPRNFLQALKNNRDKVKNLSLVLETVTEEAEFDASQKKAELEKRLEAIRSIKAETLKKVATECEKLLASDLKKYE